ncbi:MAG: fibronectin type III domain-containing protein, partial [Candidatus Hydrogenedentales bacterium]
MMKKKRIAYGLLVVAVLYIAGKEFKGQLFDWLADNYVTRTTAYPSTPQPDQISLTWSDDPRNSQTIQWRTAMSVANGVAQYRLSAEVEGAVQEIAVTPFVLEDKLLVNDKTIHRYTAELKELQPAT